MSEIIINIDEANKAQRYKDERELFQLDAFKNVTSILKEHSSKKDCYNIVNCRFHDTIFIDGDRGVGKTAFMINIENYYNDNKKEDDNKYIFLNPIDPTLLEHTEKFLSVVLAKIVEMVSKKFDNYCIEEDKYYYNDNCDKKTYDTRPDEKCKDSYYKALENLSKSLSAIKTLDDDLGIEEIASNKSSLKLEQHAHEFFHIVCKMFGVNALVMLIDDVDMAFDKGFDVLEVVRKYLASPYLIPIVAGDMYLYREIVETQFMSKIEFQNDLRALNDAKNLCTDKEKELYCNKYKQKKELLNQLVEQYLKKVFPNEYHIKLKSIFTILKENKVNVKLSNNLSIPYTEIKDFEIRFINLGINQTKFSYQVFSNNTRDLIQYLYSKREIYKVIFGNKNYFPDDFEFEKSHRKYIPQNVMDKYDRVLMDFISNTDGLSKKSLEITSQFYEYHEGKQKELSKLTDNDVISYQNGHYNIYKAFLGEVFENSKLAKEKAVENISILSDDFKNVKKFTNYKDKYISDLFVHNNYYRDNMTKNYIISGKFLELMFFSLSLEKKLNIKHINKDKLRNLSKDDKKIENLSFEKIKESIIQEHNLNSFDLMQVNDIYSNINSIKEYFNIDMKELFPKEDFKILDDISYTVPFNSVFRTNNNYKSSDSSGSEEKNENTAIEHKKEDLQEILKEILIWREFFLDSIKINSISMYEIMHKFFNNLDVLKGKSDKLGENNALIFMQRIVFIFINAVAFFENTNIRVAETNISVSDKFSFDTILNNTNAYSQNIKPLLSKNTLTKALFFHPIISYILKESDISLLKFKKDGSGNISTQKTEKMLENYYEYNLSAIQITHKIQLLTQLLDDHTDSELKAIAQIDHFKDRFLSEHFRKATEEQLNIFNKLRQTFFDRLN